MSDKILFNVRPCGLYHLLKEFASIHEVKKVVEVVEIVRHLVCQYLFHQIAEEKWLGLSRLPRGASHWE